MDRKTRRDNERIVSNVRKKAVKDMTDWVESLPHHPTPNEIRAFQAGYIAGVNRGASNA